MDAQQIAEKVRDLIMGAMREEFREFKAEVRGQLEGFRLAIETMNKRMDAIERRMDSLERRIDETNKKIDYVRDELTARIDETNKRIDETNKRIDILSTRLEENTRGLGELKAEIAALRSRQEIIEDLVRRVRKLEDKVFA
ncbi:MAG: hypothetical protein H0Z19_10205 [Archaeoglobus sp.]|uniref:hypothetical protein n=1 Tax=Archaeoglobus sp. TaxID=1872626 RepID=UPI001E0B89C5|nr:hypothetical protein [Archaeoglobus sp.]MBO8180827.1 hypothetical protein [Archaeoglobus sp.]